jgi:hypothetical protein
MSFQYLSEDQRARYRRFLTDPSPEDLERFFYLDAVALAEVAKKRGPPVHLTAQNGDLMPERENLDLPGLVTAPGQDRELEETTEDEVEKGPQHK